ncbi:CLUMA_CG013577, isoform A [Clunio marinus]|uniref:CLUMA_CG013577, isoform A n=1 Tax=Clunio marinus TaxID=568069 RepID=A0A1J1IJC9_9DIPT|nr:CLUMA_CG013577, isoform A [Clunio marinus]
METIRNQDSRITLKVSLYKNINNDSILIYKCVKMKPKIFETSYSKFIWSKQHGEKYFLGKPHHYA